MNCIAFKLIDYLFIHSSTYSHIIYINTITRNNTFINIFVNIFAFLNFLNIKIFILRKNIFSMIFMFVLKIQGSSDLSKREENSFDFRPGEGLRNHLIGVVFIDEHYETLENKVSLPKSHH